MKTFRMTARAFRSRFHKVETPVLVGDGIWFPRATAQLLQIAEVSEANREDIAVGTQPIRPITKADQAKGKTRKK